ncbi:MAG: hypothetical protein HYZ29_33030 [Myxococcales bacterium]|nr:hypothetical protein [Myxococcales bacterium]
MRPHLVPQARDEQGQDATTARRLGHGAQVLGRSEQLCMCRLQGLDLPAQGGALGGDRPEILGIFFGGEMSTQLIRESVEQRARTWSWFVLVIPESDEELSHTLERPGYLHVLGRDRTPPAEE